MPRFVSEAGKQKTGCLTNLGSKEAWPMWMTARRAQAALRTGIRTMDGVESLWRFGSEVARRREVLCRPRKSPLSGHLALSSAAGVSLRSLLRLVTRHEQDRTFSSPSYNSNSCL